MRACVSVGANLAIPQLLDHPAEVVQPLQQLGLRLLGHGREVCAVVVQAMLAHLAEQDALAALLADGAAREAAYPRALASVLVVAFQVSHVSYSESPGRGRSAAPAAGTAPCRRARAGRGASSGSSAASSGPSPAGRNSPSSGGGSRSGRRARAARPSTGAGAASRCGSSPRRSRRRSG